MLRIQSISLDSEIYLEGNVGAGISGSVGNGQWAGVAVTGTYTKEADVRINAFPSWFTAFNMNLLPPGDTQTYVLANAGARPIDRDSVDGRVVSSVRNRNGQIINSPNEVGGWPKLAVNSRTLTLPSSPNGDDDRDGYTNLEEWLHALAAEVEGRTSGTGTKAPSPPSGVRIVNN
jgi:hypothetical protein